jgi:hypothetical protein
MYFFLPAAGYVTLAWQGCFLYKPCMDIKDLSEDQKNTICTWIAAGESLPDMQNMMREHFDFRLTFMDARILVAEIEEEMEPAEIPSTDVNLDPAPLEEEPLGSGQEPKADERAPTGPEGMLDPTPAVPAATSEAQATSLEESALPPVRVTINSVAVPGAVSNGHVSFSDGETARWHLDHAGQLRMDPTTPGYQPSRSELMAFQAELKRIAQDPQG